MEKTIEQLEHKKTKLENKVLELKSKIEAINVLTITPYRDKKSVSSINSAIDCCRVTFPLQTCILSVGAALQVWEWWCCVDGFANLVY